MNKDQFEQMAHKYNHPDRIHLAQIIAQATNQLLNHTTYHSLLDYGGGTGLVTLNIDHHFEQVTLMDASTQMVNIFDEKISALEKTSIQTLVGDILADDHPLNQSTYDVIFLSLVLLHSGDYKALLHKLYTHLNPGVMLILVDFDKNENVQHPKVYNGFKQSDILETFAQIGLSQTQAYTFYAGDHLFMNQHASVFIASGFK
ncbi:class I SAM-dependent methyltransferase [Staphylococcus saprophyticus]|uniref:class I SAM-dependent methyltransferase n=2 Tax=Staphylococcus saprophyticus TaxID=29385 RepID=UPI0008529630|nr:class I SAM-dependent methyltransferase [Staphylococcus saprophyticus]MDW4224254.1 methyltransferase domain-containing protein [Staphylococcus saprophyticus]MDW4255706.1 methyltransferase domain-containing protein [Staphylococcus saprophyticus]MDW4374197.1 methyltransferase domain-containing protein [Staphylococcus saprophyticus]OEK44550.1 methyltransferase [Staphylococcus saprophyticus]QKQ04343.1 class I SAM-dependent methyltransferase [Staphylococcus saprophyticus]